MSNANIQNRALEALNPMTSCKSEDMRPSETVGLAEGHTARRIELRAQILPSSLEVFLPGLWVFYYKIHLNSCLTTFPSNKHLDVARSQGPHKITQRILKRQLKTEFFIFKISVFMKTAFLFSIRNKIKIFLFSLLIFSNVFRSSSLRKFFEIVLSFYTLVTLQYFLLAQTKFQNFLAVSPFLITIHFFSTLFNQLYNYFLSFQIVCYCICHGSLLDEKSLIYTIVTLLFIILPVTEWGQDQEPNNKTFIYSNWRAVLKVITGLCHCVVPSWTCHLRHRMAMTLVY